MGAMPAGAAATAESAAFCVWHAAQLAKINAIAAARATNRCVDITPPDLFCQINHSAEDATACQH
jgi:hypothetical protein